MQEVKVSFYLKRNEEKSDGTVQCQSLYSRIPLGY